MADKFSDYEYLQDRFDKQLEKETTELIKKSRKNLKQRYSKYSVQMLRLLPDVWVDLSQRKRKKQREKKC